MITKKDLHEAIAECQGERNPDARTCIKLAAYYTILNNLKNSESNNDSDSGYSYSPAPENQFVPLTPVVETYEKYIDFQKSTDFSRLIDGKDASKVWEVIDELMQTLKLIMPQLYDGTMQKIRAKTQ